MKVVTLLALAGFTQALHNYTDVDGVVYHATIVGSDGVEIPAEIGPHPHRFTGRLSESLFNDTAIHKRTDISVTSNWCGMVNPNVPSGTKWTQIYGKWIVPQLWLRSGQTSSYISQWVGIDGIDTCSTGALFLAGTYSQIDSSGTQSNSIILDWYPAYSVTLNNFPVNTGDTISVLLTTSSSTGGLAFFVNHNTGQSGTITVPDGSNVQAACGYQVDWILSGPSSSGSVAFPNFQNTAFTNGYSVTNNYINEGPTPGNDVYLSQTGGPNGGNVCEGYWDETNQDIVTRNFPS